jgi:hypothetical protein
MAIDDRNKVMVGIMGHHGDDYRGLDPKLPTPTNYAEYVASVQRKGGKPATEAQLEAGIAKVEADNLARKAKNVEDETDVLKKLGLTRGDLRNLKTALERL